MMDREQLIEAIARAMEPGLWTDARPRYYVLAWRKKLLAEATEALAAIEAAGFVVAPREPTPAARPGAAARIGAHA